MSDELSWRERAWLLKGDGVPLRAIAQRVGVSLTSVAKLFNPGYAERQRQGKLAAARRRYATDPQYRAERQAAARRKRPCPTTPES